MKTIGKKCAVLLLAAVMLATTVFCTEVPVSALTLKATRSVFLSYSYTRIGLPGWTLGGILADIVLKAGQYKNFNVTLLSYACFCPG